MRWFSIRGIFSELRLVVWPKPKKLAKDSMTVTVFVFFLGIFFFLCQLLTSAILQLIGV